MMRSVFVQTLRMTMLMMHISRGAVARRWSSEVFIWTKFAEIPQHIPEISNSQERRAFENIHHMLFLAMAVRGIRQQVYNNFLTWQENLIILQIGMLHEGNLMMEGRPCQLHRVPNSKNPSSVFFKSHNKAVTSHSRWRDHECSHNWTAKRHFNARCNEDLLESPCVANHSQLSPASSSLTPVSRCHVGRRMRCENSSAHHPSLSFPCVFPRTPSFQFQSFQIVQIQ